MLKPSGPAKVSKYLGTGLIFFYSVEYDSYVGNIFAVVYKKPIRRIHISNDDIMVKYLEWLSQGYN